MSTTKHSRKIKKVTDLIKTHMGFDQLVHIKTLNHIANTIINTKEMNYTYEIIETYMIPAIHKKNEYPLMYIFFTGLKEIGILDEIIKYTPNINDFEVFVKWYREHIEHIDFDKIHKVMDNISQYKNLIEIYLTIFKPIPNRAKLHDMIYDNKFIGLAVHHEVESLDIEYINYSIINTKTNNKHTVELYIPQYAQHLNIDRICQIIQIMENLALDNNIQSVPIKLSVICSNAEKRIYPEVKIICSDNVNSGSTIPGITITCWRKEEFYKVLIHELIHYYHFDFSIMDSSYQKLDDLIQLPSVEGFDAINECYTESFAIIIHSLMFAYQNNNSLNNSQLITEFYEILKTEISFITFQVAKILSIFGASTIKDYFSGKIILRQQTSFRSYFIIKLMLLLNINDLLKFMDENVIIHNNRLIDFGHLVNKSYTKFIEDYMNITVIDILIDQFRKIFMDTSHKHRHQWIIKTCRMSANDFLIM